MTSSELRRRQLPLLFALVTAVAAPSFAQSTAPSAADLESARALFKQGKELRTQGQLEPALEKFKAAHAYGQTPITGLELGRTHYQLKHYIDAREVLLSVGRMKVAADESENSASARREAKDLAAQIQPLIAGVEVHVGNAPNTKVTVDGADVPVISGVVERQVDPGPHKLAARVDGGEEVTQEVTLADGEHKSVDLAPKAPGTGAAAAVPETAPAGALPVRQAPPPSRKSGLSPLVYVGFGTAAAGLVVGAITGAFALSDAGKADDLCGAGGGHQCVSASARDDAEAKRKNGQTMATISTVSFIVAGVGAAVGVTGLFLPRSSSKAKSASIAPILGVGYAGVGGRF